MAFAFAEEFVPEGFENINNDYSGLSATKINDDYFGEIEIDFIEASDTVTLSESAVKKIIDHLKDNLKLETIPNLKKSLRKTMKANITATDKVLILDNDDVTCYFSDSDIELYLYIPYKYFKEVKASYDFPMHYPAGEFSVPNLLTNLQFRNNPLKNKHIDWQLKSTLSSNRARLVINANDSVRDHFNELYVTYLRKDMQYDFGYLNPPGGAMLAPSFNLWGISMYQNPELINKKFYSSYKTPFILILDKPANVTIKYRGEQLYYKTLPYGENIINTKDFPDGIYSVTVEKEDLLTNVVTTEEKIYYGNSIEYNWLYSGFSMSFGFESEFIKTISTMIKPYFSIKNGYVFHNGKLDLSLIHSNSNNYAGLSYTRTFENNIFAGLSSMLDSSADLFFSASTGYNNFVFYFRRGFLSNLTEDGAHTNLGISYQYRIPESWFFRLNGDYDNNKVYDSSLSAFNNFNFYGNPVGVNLSVSYSSENKFIALASTSVSFLDYEYRNNDYGLLFNTMTGVDYSPNKNLFNFVTRSNLEKDNFKVNNMISLNTAGDANYINTMIIHDAGKAKISSEFNVVEEEGSIEIKDLQLELKTNVSFTPFAYAVTSERSQAGYLINTPNFKDDYSLFYDEYEVKGGSSHFIAARPYTNHPISLVTDNNDLSILNPDHNTFFYPGNVTSIDLDIRKSCFVSFSLDVSEDALYTMFNREDDIYGFGKDSNTVQLFDGEEIKIKSLSEDVFRSCDTGVVVTCGDSEFVELGALKCIPIDKTISDYVSESKEVKASILEGIKKKIIDINRESLSFLVKNNIIKSFLLY